jgi:hypothetical protein
MKLNTVKSNVQGTKKSICYVNREEIQDISTDQPHKYNNSTMWVKAAPETSIRILKLTKKEEVRSKSESKWCYL